MEKAIVLIDGEHYIPVTKWAVDSVVRKKYDVIAGVFIGGMEKIGTKGDLKAFDFPVIVEDDPLEGILLGIDRYQPDVMVDLSDEPVVGYEIRFSFANIILNRGISYAGADFRFDPPVLEDVLRKPSISVVGTAKRIGKTAACAYIARLLSGQEDDEKKIIFDPCIVTMGRGGPLEPELIPGKELNITPDYLLKMANLGKHAASDHYEDALMTRLTTIGSRRCGGGFAGVVFASNVNKSAELANELPEDLVLIEGSGASFPSLQVDAQILIVGAHQPLSHIAGYMGPYRIMRSDLIILTMCELPMVNSENIQEMDRAIRGINNSAKVVHTIFRPSPLENIEGAKALLAVTAPESIAPILSKSLEKNHGCKIIATSSNLANRPKLRNDISRNLKEHPEIDTVITEVKAAGIDVVTRMATEVGKRVVFIDNILVTIGGDTNLPKLIKEVAQKAVSHHAS